MPFLHWVEDDTATGDVAAIYQDWKNAHPGRPRMPEILKAMSLRPDLLRAVIDISYPLHFSDGFLSRQTKEMIATFVSGLNQCPY